MSARATKPATGRRTAIAALAAAVLAGCSGGTSPHPSGTSSTTTGGVSLSALEGQNGAATPTASSGSYVASVPGSAKAASYFRSEGFWALDGRRVQLHEGERIHLDMTVTPHLAGAGKVQNQWSVVWQLHGPMGDNSWPAPVLTLSIDKGTWRLGGGAGHPDGDRSSTSGTYPPYVDGQAAHWVIDLTVSSNPRTAVVNATMNGQQVASNWHPRAGTLYPGQQWVGLKSGLYTGGLSGAKAVTGARSVKVQLGTLTVTSG